MSPILQSLGIDQLSRDERLVLVQEIWNSIATESHPSLLDEGRREELEKRIAEDDASPDDVIPWEQVKAQIMDRLKPS